MFLFGGFILPHTQIVLWVSFRTEDPYVDQSKLFLSPPASKTAGWALSTPANPRLGKADFAGEVFLRTCAGWKEPKAKGALESGSLPFQRVE